MDRGKEGPSLLCHNTAESQYFLNLRKTTILEQKDSGNTIHHSIIDLNSHVLDQWIAAGRGWEGVD